MSVFVSEGTVRMEQAMFQRGQLRPFALDAIINGGYEVYRPELSRPDAPSAGGPGNATAIRRNLSSWGGPLLARA